jgi:lysophospholipase L1-like esterase
MAMRRSVWAKRLLLLALTLVLLAVLDVAAARVYRLVTGHTWPAGDPERVYRIPADGYHHDLRPNYATDAARWGGSYPVRTNSLGFRDAKVRDVPLAPAGRRIVVIGDSFTEGVGVPYGDTFVGRVGAALAPGTEVLDAAAMSYAPCMYYRKVRHLIGKGLRFDELIVAVDVGDAEDEAVVYEFVDDEVRARGLKGRAQDVIKTNSILLFTILDALLREPPGHVAPPPPLDLDAPDAAIEAALRRLGSVGVRRSRWPHDERLWREYGEAGVKLMTAHMDLLLALLREKGIALTVVVYPWPDQIVAGDPQCRAVTVWRDWCKARGVRFVDSFPKFEVGAPWRRRAEILDSCYIPGDVHLSAEGHRRVAEAILEAVR